MSWQETIKGQKKLFVRNKTLNDKEVLLDNTPALSEEQKLREAKENQKLKFKLEAERRIKPGQQQLAKEDDCITDNDLRIDRLEELIENINQLITLTKYSDSQPNRNFRKEIAEAYNTLIGTYNEVYEDMFCFKNQLDNE
tara:strand:- start:9299 stop:9718 length:420 start_codon:yes stop_codon:yes gene_type:complete